MDKPIPRVKHIVELDVERLRRRCKDIKHTSDSLFHFLGGSNQRYENLRGYDVIHRFGRDVTLSEGNDQRGVLVRIVKSVLEEDSLNYRKDSVRRMIERHIDGSGRRSSSFRS